jgi:thymidylate kinase
VAQELDFEFIEKPLHYLTDTEGMDNYLRIMNTINAQMEPDFTAMYYGLGNLYLNHLSEGKNIVTDRYLCSTYFWNCTDHNKKFFDYLVSICKAPDLTVILYADSEVRRQRIMGRDPNDKDLCNKVLPNERYEKMIDFVRTYSMNYTVLDTSEMDMKTVVKKIIALACK